MCIAQWIEKLNIPAESAQALSLLPPAEPSAGFKEVFFSNPEAFRERAASLHGLEILKLYLTWLDDTKQRYSALGIPESYFRDSCRDIPIWCLDHLERFQKPGFLEWDWVGKTLRMEVIRIGRLQFEPDTLQRELIEPNGNYPAGTPILHVHIPAGEPLDVQAVANSLEHAPLFFKTYFQQEFALFHCHSWLLSPDLKEILPENSRILRFQDLFQVYATDSERQAEERVFGFLSDDPARYPENTSLQAAVKRRLLSGKSVRMAVGIRKIP